MTRVLIAQFLGPMAVHRRTRVFVCFVLVWIAVRLSIACSEQDHQPLAASEQTTNKVDAMSAQMLIKLGESGIHFAKRYPDQVRVTNQPAGLDFYNARWPKAPHASVKVESGSHAFTVAHVLSVQSAQELGPLAGEGLYEFTINAGITEPDLIAHDEARVKTYAILNELVRIGWKPVVERSEPRLRGKDRFDHTMATESVNGLDPDYLPTLEEWMRIESRTPWMFHAPGAYLEVTFTRERTLIDPAKPGSYMLTFNVQTEAEHFRGYVASDDRPRWKVLLPKVLSGLSGARAQKEKELRAKGVRLDEAYVDPPAP